MTERSHRDLDQKNHASESKKSPKVWPSLTESCSHCGATDCVSGALNDTSLSSDDVMSRVDPGNHAIHNRMICSYLSDDLPAARDSMKSTVTRLENTTCDVSMNCGFDRLRTGDKNTSTTSSKMLPGHTLHRNMDRNGDKPEIRDDTQLLDNTEDDSTSPISHIARQLAIIGDDVNERYRSEFNRMRYDVTITTTASIHGNLMGIVYRSLHDRLCSHVITRAVGAVFKLVTSDQVTSWILDQTRVTAETDYMTDTLAWSTITLLCTGAALSILSLVVIKRTLD